jgi:hypothetical protein
MDRSYLATNKYDRYLYFLLLIFKIIVQHSLYILYCNR